MSAALPRGLYLITRESADTGTLLARVRAALEGGAVLVQYRDKSNDAARRLTQARALYTLCAEFGAPLLVNDDVALARAVGAAGVHLGEHDSAIGAARVVLGSDAIIGASCYDDLARARTLAAAGADYLAFGSFFASSSKDTTRRATTQLLRDAAVLQLPRVAIGGITAENAAPLIAAGAQLLAVIAAVFDAPEPRAAAARFRTLFDSIRTS
jgi:thiamine-phosphate pyrophosphorylase